MASVTRRSHADRASRQVAMRAKMLEAVETLLEEGETFTELSVERIVAEANISRSTFYVYFEDKGHLLRALTEDLLELMVAAGRGWWARLDEGDFGALRAGIDNLVDVYRAHTTLMAAIVDTSSYDVAVREEFHAVILGGQEELADQIRRGQAAGTVRGDLDPARTAGWLAWMVEHGLHQLVRGADDSEAERLAEALARILWNALYAQPDVRQAPPTPMPPETPSVSPVM